MKSLKQAVVVVHGMGEQQPMQTIRDFVKAVWMKDEKLDDPHFWNKPSTVSQSFEQRRLTTNNPNVKGRHSPVTRIDFYEYYWAHHTVGSTLEHFKGWFFALIWRNPKHIFLQHRHTLFPVFVILWTLLITAAVVLVCGDWFSDSPSAEQSAAQQCAAGQPFYSCPPFQWKTMIATVFTLAGGGLTYFLVNYFGDVARYVSANPANIDIRQNIRKGGIELLERIQQTGDYDRIVLVGHSLGSIIAYDLLNHMWARHNKFADAQGKEQALTQQAKDLCDELGRLAGQITDEPSQTVYRNKQHELFHHLKQNTPGHNWLISDFITLGSPLTYADVLLFKDEKQFMWRKLDREYPTSPPVHEQHKIYYGKDQAFMHHAAVFAPVRWSNIYSNTRMLVFGDIISGPVGQQFYPPKDEKPVKVAIGPIREIALDWSLSDGFTHTKYWEYRNKPKTNQHLQKLRQELNLYG